MKFACLVLPLALACTGCLALKTNFPSSDCTGAAPAGFTRIFIGAPAPGGSQSGTSADDPLDGTTADKFDTILRTIGEGGHPTWGAQQNIGPENLVACVESGTFETNGRYDWAIDVGHTLGSELGFTVQKNWRIHGHGKDETILKLAAYIPQQLKDANGNLFNAGANAVIATETRDASGVEVSDLTIDANHDGMTNPGGTPLTLQAIALRSERGGDWIHDVNVIGASGDPGAIFIPYETFAIEILGSGESPLQNTGNLIENAVVTAPGTAVLPGEFAGGKICGIVVANAGAEVRNSTVEGYYVGYAGWAMDSVSFHDNVSSNTGYGFNTDSFSNFRVTLQSNQFIHPLHYGIVIGGAGSSQNFSGWSVLNNTIALVHPQTIGLVLRGQVQNSQVSGNTITADASGLHAAGIFSYSSGPGVLNSNNLFANNHVDSSLTIDFSSDPFFASDCRMGNRSLQGGSLPGFADNSNSPACQPANTLINTQ